MTTIQVRAERSRPTGLRIEKAFVEVHTPIVWIALEALLAQARVVARRVYAMRVHSTRAGNVAFVGVEAQLLAVALVARLAFAKEMRGQVAALGILHATSGDRGVCTLVNVCGWTRRSSDCCD